MATMTLVIGESGSGKSTSITTLNPKETFLISVTNRALSSREFKKDYKPHKKDDPGNYVHTRDFEQIESLIQFINMKRPEIKNIVIDDFQYIMAFEAMNKADEKGYEKFTKLAQRTWKILEACLNCRTDLNCFVLSHNAVDEQGKSRCKTVGKMLDNTIDIHGIFDNVFHTVVVDGQYKFLTQHDGHRLARTLRGLFAEKLIDNDLGAIRKAIDEYYLL